MPDFIGYRYNTPITQILDRLYLGGFKNAEDLTVPNPYGITHVVNCTQEPLLKPPIAVSPWDRTGLVVLQLDQLDGHPWSQQKVHDAVCWIQRSIMCGRTVLAHCHAGMSRSPSLVAGYLYACGFSFPQALAMLRELRPWVRPEVETLNSVMRAFGVDPDPPPPVNVV